MNFHVDNEAQLGDWAKKFARNLKAGDFISLRGTLGAGKTSLSRAIIRELMNDPDLDVPSPTYTLIQQYETPVGLISHFDLYRLEEADEVFELGWEEALYDSLCLVEWSEKAQEHLPEDRLEITLSIPADDKDSRELTLTPYGLWTTRPLD